MIGWIIAGVVVLALLTLVFWASGRDKHRGDRDLDTIAHRSTTMRNDSSGTTGLL